MVAINNGAATLHEPATGYGKPRVSYPDHSSEEERAIFTEEERSLLLSPGQDRFSRGSSALCFPRAGALLLLFLFSRP